MHAGMLLRLQQLHPGIPKHRPLCAATAGDATSGAFSVLCCLLQLDAAPRRLHVQAPGIANTQKKIVNLHGHVIAHIIAQ